MMFIYFILFVILKMMMASIVYKKVKALLDFVFRFNIFYCFTILSYIEYLQ